LLLQFRFSFFILVHLIVIFSYFILFIWRRHSYNYRYR